MQENLNDDDLLRGDGQAANFLGVSKVTLWKLKGEGLPFYQVRRTFLYKKSELLDFLIHRGQIVERNGN